MSPLQLAIQESQSSTTEQQSEVFHPLDKFVTKNRGHNRVIWRASRLIRPPEEDSGITLLEEGEPQGCNDSNLISLLVLLLSAECSHRLSVLDRRVGLKKASDRKTALVPSSVLALDLGINP